MMFFLFAQFMRSDKFTLNSKAMGADNGLRVEIKLASGYHAVYHNVTYFRLYDQKVVINSDIHSQGVTWMYSDTTSISVDWLEREIEKEFERALNPGQRV